MNFKTILHIKMLNIFVYLYDYDLITQYLIVTDRCNTIRFLKMYTQIVIQFYIYQCISVVNKAIFKSDSILL